jgi:serpin B
VLTTQNALEPVSSVTAQLAGKGVQYFVKNSSSANKTIIKLPRLKLSGELDLRKLFASSGMKNIFDPQIGGLYNMVEKRVLYISQAKQLVKLNLDENGTEVAAVTYAIAKCASAPPGVVKYNHFYADHPFVLVLFDSQTNAILLAGVIVDPGK